VANHAWVAAAGSVDSAFSETVAEGVGVGVCAYAAIENTKTRETTSHEKISRLIMDESIEKSVLKGKRRLQPTAQDVGLVESLGWTSKFSQWKIGV
jgi:hypothetical protein